MTILVPDASVILKWVIPTHDEKDLSQALLIRNAALEERTALAAPTLWRHEIGNTLARRFPEQSLASFNALLGFNFREHDPHGSYLEEILRLTRTYNVTFYDAAYHALALTQGGTFVTADLKYIGKAAAAGGVISLNDWPPEA